MTTRALLIEDHLTDAHLLREMLEFAGMDWTLEHVWTFAEAAGRWPSGQFEVLLLDLDLPDGLGLELLARALSLAGEVPVVVLSGLADDRVAAQAGQLGVRGYVIKGLEAAEHLRRIMEGPTPDQT
jgi:CheY-like chemotaxis protein